MISLRNSMPGLAQQQSARHILVLFAALLAVLLAAMLAGCAARQTPPPPRASACWGGFLNRYAAPPAAHGLLANASLSWRQGKKTARVIIDLWGNFERGGGEGEFRMDAWSNVGGSLSYILEDGPGIVALYPDPPRVYTHTDPVEGARMLGLPFPFSLAHFAALLAGDFGALVPPAFDAAVPGPDDGWVFTFDQGPVSTLGLDAASRPVLMEGPSLDGAGKPAGTWRIELSRYALPQHGGQETSGPEQAERLELTLPPESFGILRIKTRELTVAPWQQEAMELNIPEQAEVLTLDHSPRDWTTGQAPQPPENQ